MHLKSISLFIFLTISLLVAACGGGSSSGGGGDLAGTCTFNVAGNGTVSSSAIVQAKDEELARQINSDCRAAAAGLEIARNYCSYPLETRHLPTVKRRGASYGFIRPHVHGGVDIPRRELPANVVGLAVGNYMMEAGVDQVSCHGLGERLGALIG